MIEGSLVRYEHYLYETATPVEFFKVKIKFGILRGYSRFQIFKKIKVVISARFLTL